MKRRVSIIALLIITIFLISGCGASDNNANNSNTDTSTESNKQEEQDTEELENTEESENAYNINGRGFSIGQDCLNVYLDYIGWGAEDDYKLTDIKENEIDEYWWEEVGDKFAYFSIAGMCDGEPCLLLSSTNDQNHCGDEIYFITYTPMDTSGEGIDQIHIQGNGDIMSFDMMPNISVEKSTIYVCTDSYTNDVQFMYEEDVVHYLEGTGDKSSTYYNIFLNYGKLTTKDTGSRDFQKLIDEGHLAPIKWFSKDQVDEARAYYQQYVRENASDEPTETVNRADYFNGNTPLQYIEYFDEGVLEVTDDWGITKYTFTGLSESLAGSLIFRTDIPNSVEFFYGSDTTNVKYNIILNNDGSWTAVVRQLITKRSSYTFTMWYETREDQILEDYTHTGESRPSTIEELIDLLQ